MQTLAENEPISRIKFTDRWLSTVKSNGQDEYIDASCPNLRLRVGKRTKTFSVMIGDAKSRRRVMLGKYPSLSLAEARQKAGATTDDPAVTPVAKKECRFGTVKDLFEFAIRSMKAEEKSSVEANRIYLLNGPLAAIHTFGEATLARNIRPNDVTSWLREIHKAGVRTQHPRAYLSAAFGRGIRADNDPTADVGEILYGIDANPVVNVDGGGVSSARSKAFNRRAQGFLARLAVLNVSSSSFGCTDDHCNAGNAHF